MISRHLTVLLLVLQLGQVESTQAQTIIEMETEPQSVEYVLDIEQLVTIGMEESISPISLFSNIKVDENGRIYIGPTHESFQICVYNSTGEEVTSFGQSGGGPGEFSRIQEVVIGEDGHLFVYDIISRRLSVLSGNQYLQSFNLQSSPQSILPVGDGRLLLQMSYRDPRTPDHAIMLLHLYTSSGDSLLSFSPLESEYHYDRPWIQRRSLARANDEEIWSAHQNRHQVELWSLSGELKTVIKSNPEWFQPWEISNPEAPWNAPPEPQLSSIQQDSVGRLWILSRVPGANWERLELGGNERIMPSLDWMNAAFDTVVEVIDPLTGKLLIRETLQGNRAEFIGNGLIAEKRERPDGDGMVIIWKLSLRTH